MWSGGSRMKLKNMLLLALCLLLVFPLSTCGGPSSDKTDSLPPPPLSSVENRADSVLIKWSGVEGARQYRVLRRTEGGSWIHIGDTDSLSFTDKTVEDGVNYSYTVCCVSRDGKKVMSRYDEIGLAVYSDVGIKILSQPVSVNAHEGEIVSFEVKVSGEDLRYEWQYSASNGKNWDAVTSSQITGKKSAVMTVPVSSNRNGYKYRCKVTSGSDTVYSDAATLTMIG